jgi:hypothetical protein
MLFRMKYTPCRFALHAELRRANVILFAHLRLGPFHRDALVPGVRLNPSLILIGPARQDCLVNHRLTDNIVEKVHHLPRPRQTAQISVDDHSVKTVVYKNKQAAKQPCKRLHRSSSLVLVSWFQNFKYFWLA